MQPRHQWRLVQGSVNVPIEDILFGAFPLRGGPHSRVHTPTDESLTHASLISSFAHTPLSTCLHMRSHFHCSAQLNHRIHCSSFSLTSRQAEMDRRKLVARRLSRQAQAVNQLAWRSGFKRTPSMRSFASDSHT